MHGPELYQQSEVEDESPGDHTAAELPDQGDEAVGFDQAAAADQHEAVDDQMAVMVGMDNSAIQALDW